MPLLVAQCFFIHFCGKPLDDSSKPPCLLKKICQVNRSSEEEGILCFAGWMRRSFGALWVSPCHGHHVCFSSWGGLAVHSLGSSWQHGSWGELRSHCWSCSCITLALHCWPLCCISGSYIQGFRIKTRLKSDT